MMDKNLKPDIPPRFHPPENWVWDAFKNKGRSIRYGYVIPKKPDAIIVALQGVREFTEKYFETAHWALENNYAFWMMDWAGQGKSTRFLKNPQKRHSLGFDSDLDDFHYFMTHEITHQNDAPITMLAHSMGANIGLRYLPRYPTAFSCAALSSPMIGIKVFSAIPDYISHAATGFFNKITPESYIFGGSDWKNCKGHARLTYDPVRKDIHGRWCAFDPALKSGDITFGWLHEAHKSCLALQSPAIYKNIKTPCFFGIPGHEDLVDNRCAKKIISEMENAKIIDYPDSAHEILMERDHIRDDFLYNFSLLIKETAPNHH